MSRSDDRTKLMPTPARDDGADDRTRAMPASGAAAPEASEPEARPDPGEGAADDATRTIPTGEPSADDRTRMLDTARADGSSAEDRTRMLGANPADGSSAEDRTRMLGSTPTDDATAIIGETAPTPDSGDGHTDDATVALAPGAAAAAAASAMEDDVTVVRPQAKLQPRILMKSPAGKVEEHPLENEETVIGRASSCTLVVANPEVSRKHARIITGPLGVVLHVEGERRNTTVNGQLVEGEQILKHGDVLELASERLIFAETAETPPFEGEQAAADAPRSLTVPIIAAVGVAALGLGAYLLGSSSQPPQPHQQAAPVVAAPPAIDPARQAEVAAQAAEAAKVAATEEVRKVAEREAEAARVAQREERIRKLLYEGDIALLEKRFTTPPNGSAFYAFNEVLKIDPENEQAKTRIAEMLETYLGWAESARASGNRTKARVYADKAAYIREQAPSVGDGAKYDERITAIRGRAG